MKKETPPQKNESGVPAIGQGPSLLKKNEFTMILITALVITVLIFFFFFKGSSTPKPSEQEIVSGKVADQASPNFEARISAIEISLAQIASSASQKEKQAAARAISSLDERITRIETAVNLKLDTLIERVDKLEDQLRKLAVVASTPAPKKVTEPAPKVKKPAIAPKKKVQVAQKKVQKSKVVTPKKTGQFHTVQQGETLWSISQKYKTSVAAIRKLNNLTPEDKIYPGGNLLVR